MHKNFDLQETTNEPNKTRKSASAVTCAKNTIEAYRAGVVGEYSSEHEYASCGCCKESIPTIKGVWNQRQYQFLRKVYNINSEHLRVHPALWNNGTNNVLSGVFEVLPGKIYQVRGYDMANITFVKTNNIGNTGFSSDDHWMVMDTLMSTECTQAALELFSDYLLTKIGNNYSLDGNIVGMIISHSHVDHYGGMSVVKEWFTTKKTTDEEDAPAIPFILAPYGFVEHSVSENVYVGNAMGRRASYQYGSFIKPSVETSDGDCFSGEISIGIGQGQSTGSISFEVPTREITKNCSLTLDGLDVEFQLTPGTEAPAEMNNYFPAYAALWLAENCNGTLHNLYTLRGAQVRDGKAWARYLMETVALYGDSVEVIFQSHNWPHWGGETSEAGATTNKDDNAFPQTDLKKFLIDTASIYKYINDQTLLYMNMGYKMNEASDMLTLPRAMQKNWCLKPFYGTPKHNAKAVYQKYLGWYDANPLHLEELPPEVLAKEQIRYFTSNQSMMDTIQSDINAGNYWIAAYMAHQIVLGSSDETEVASAKLLCADAMEQLGYQSESGTWRNAYLAAAYELRNSKGRVSANAASMTNNMTTEMLLDYISILFDGERAAKLDFDGYLSVTDGHNTENYIFCVKNGAILYHPVSVIPNSTTTLKIGKSTLGTILAGTYTCQDSGKSDKILEDISKSIVVLQCDRYKYFDIMGRHDSEVKIDDNIYNIPDIAKSCFLFLEGLTSRFCLLDSQPKTTEVSLEITIESNEAKEWFNYYRILGTATGLLSADNFFSTVGSSECDDEKGTYKKTFKEYELYYDLYCLLRYFGAPYLKNDTGELPDSLRNDATELDRYYKLKKKIQLLETLVPDFYLGAESTNVEIDGNEASEWKYLTQNSLWKNGFDITYFFWTLFNSYHTFVRTLGIMGTYIRFRYTESSSRIYLAYDIPENETFCVSWNNVSVEVQGSGTLDISINNSTYLRIIVAKDETEVDSITFYVPHFEVDSASKVASIKLKEILQGSDEFVDVSFIDMDAVATNIMPYNAPDRPIYYQLTYSTKNVNSLKIEGDFGAPLPSGTVSIPYSQYDSKPVATVKAYSDCGFFVSNDYALS